MRVTQEKEVVQGHSEDKSKAGVQWHFKETDRQYQTLLLSISVQGSHTFMIVSDDTQLMH